MTTVSATPIAPPRQRWPPGMRQLAAVRGISRWQRGRTTTGRSRPGAEGGSNARSRRGTHRPGSRNEPSVRRRPRPADPGAAARHLQPGVRPPVPTDHRGRYGSLGVGGVDDCPHETPPSGFSVKVKGYAGRRVQTTSTSRLDLYGSHQERSASRPRRPQGRRPGRDTRVVAYRVRRPDRSHNPLCSPEDA